MGGLTDRVWLRYAILFVLITALVTGAVIAIGGKGGGHLAANRDQLRRACDGALPYGDLERLVRDARPGELRQHGTMLAPGRESRSLLDCSLSWGGGNAVTVHAEALVSDVPQGMETRQIVDPGPGGTFTAPGTTGRYGARGAWLVADCLGGLDGRVRPTTDLYVTARVTDGRTGADRTTALTGFRTAVHVANAITRAQRCGGRPLDPPSQVVATARTAGDQGGGGVTGPSARRCDWISPSSVPGLRPGAWTTRGDAQDSTSLSACTGDWDPGAPRNEGVTPQDWQITGVEAASWAGILGRSAYDSYEREGHVPGWGADEENRLAKAGSPDTDASDAVDRVPSYLTHPQLALWAQSVCGGRVTYHRVSVLPRLHIPDGETVPLGPGQRAALAETAHTLLARYLGAEDGWPKSAGCRDTKVLGEVEEWH
ncbi:hypothetical protein [Streptomyces sp. Rer75]|uniref:hypothetical protein n=1 Tax=unclassified Streptomyces TaxID=2593676 RepID=UPI0015CFB921|nr:hypothetical protein [Streptomyces sp. Rer75]QLH24210.1 hypothetical protein HYQ63_29225 [Streptomyces sp. Rer75]